MFTIETIVVVSATFFVAGLVKGVIGMGLPSVSLGVLTAVLGLQPAMALLLAPSFVTNAWQAVVGGGLAVLIRRLWPFLAAALGGIWIGIELFVLVDVALLARLLGALLAAYAALGLLHPQLSLPHTSERWAGPAAGIANGVFTGLTGSFVVPGVPYLQALGLTRDALIQAMGILFTLSTVGLAIALGGKRLLSAELGLMSLAAIMPAMIGMVCGQGIRRLLSEALFRKVLFLSLLALGIYIMIR